MKNRLIELLKKADENAANKCITDYEDALADNADYLLENGVSVLPCKLGECGYWVTQGGIVPVVFDRIFLNGRSEWRVRSRYKCTETVYFEFEHFGRIVFLAYEEAEKALAKLKKKHTEV